ncbi:hypothetical protein Taro_006652 [Colocasia esculenta]|uniref:Uncharacterized protein n=1 Tax=Colocasia esculenta TaxID=4460 RepID=A0A843TY91_COLES|nr:hypothetical protein [Colocasia esculenta]
MQSCILGNPNSCLTMGRVEELWVAEELWTDHKKLIFFPFSSAVTCTNRSLEVDQRVVWRSSWWLRSCGMTTRSSSSFPSRLLRPAQTVHLKSTKGTDPVNAMAR